MTSQQHSVPIVTIINNTSPVSDAQLAIANGLRLPLRRVLFPTTGRHQPGLHGPSFQRGLQLQKKRLRDSRQQMCPGVRNPSPIHKLGRHRRQQRVGRRHGHGHGFFRRGAPMRQGESTRPVAQVINMHKRQHGGLVAKAAMLQKRQRRHRGRGKRERGHTYVVANHVVATNVPCHQMCDDSNGFIPHEYDDLRIEDLLPGRQKHKRFSGRTAHCKRRRQWQRHK